MRCFKRWCGFALAAARLLLAPEPVAAQRALDVPYVAQSEALCGGAASAMVLRYWGARGVGAEEFVSLLNARRDGIETRVLVDALVGRGWRAFPFTGTSSSVTRHLSLQRPIIALIAIAPGRFHYVVLVEITDSLVVYHDPAGRPFQTMSMADFERAWSASSRWSLLLMPGETTARNDVPLEATPAIPEACRPDLLQAATAAAQRPVRPRRTTDRRRARRMSVGCRAAARAGRPALAAVADRRSRAAGARGRCARLFGPSRLENPWHGGVPPTQPGRGVERLEPCWRTCDGFGAGRRPGAHSASCRDGSDRPDARSAADVVRARARATQTVGTACRRPLARRCRACRQWARGGSPSDARAPTDADHSAGTGDAGGSRVGYA